MADDPRVQSKESSYTYWVRQQTDQAAPAPVPRRLSAADLAENTQSVPLGSLWNQAGTWEEKNLTNWATKRIKELLLSMAPLEFPEGGARVTGVSNCIGEATLVTVRNKRRIGYSYEITLGFEGDWKEAKELEGTLKIPEVCFSDLDELQLDVTFTKERDATDYDKSELTEALKSFLPAIREKMQMFEEELEQR